MTKLATTSNRGGGGVLLSAGNRCAGGGSPEHMRDAALLARARREPLRRTRAAHTGGPSCPKEAQWLQMVTGLIRGFVDRPFAELSASSRRLCCMVLRLDGLPPVAKPEAPTQDETRDPTSASYLPKLPPHRRVREESTT